jgi:hypothetical protein
MKKKLLAVVFGFSMLTLVGATVWAGQRSAESVSINTVNRTVTGSIASARGSADGNQLIGCAARWFSNGTINGSCFARNSGGTFVSCNFTTLNLAGAVSGIDSGSRLQFAYDAGGICTSIYVDHGSNWAPKTP